MPNTSKTAVLLVNTGSPSAPTPEALAQYLAEFLGDPRVVEMPRILWKPILHGIIIPKRCKASAERYKSVWTEEGSPLMAGTARVCRALQAKLGEDYDVDWAMCYGTRRIGEIIPQIIERKPAHLVVVPLFPQYATQTTEAVYDAVDAALKKSGTTVSVDRVKEYFLDEKYIGAVATKIRDARGNAEDRKPHLLISFHGIPEASTLRGDPYESQCKATARAIAHELRLTDDEWSLAFQSKFGRAKWIGPSAIDKVQELAGRGIKDLDVVCPGFSIDCLETIEEIGDELARFYAEAGGEHFRYITAINDSPEAIDAYASVVHRAFNG